jgi:hypothetical protein
MIVRNESNVRLEDIKFGDGEAFDLREEGQYFGDRTWFNSEDAAQAQLNDNIIFCEERAKTDFEYMKIVENLKACKIVQVNISLSLETLKQPMRNFN